jgi:hypothetical protein
VRGSEQKAGAGKTNYHPHSASALGYFLAKGVWQIDAATAHSQVALVQFLDTLEVLLQASFERGWQHGHPVLGTFSVPHGNLVVAEVDVLHPHAHCMCDPIIEGLLYRRGEERA